MKFVLFCVFALVGASYARYDEQDSLETVEIQDSQDQGQVPEEELVQESESESEEFPEIGCIANRDGCQPNGHQGVCCSGFCYKEPGWVTGYCR
ncbi:hypothetical protein GE061_010279 [Apolygus lucorum]|uniref:Invertebrate defensins family profile domain-containing protein n=1 Tax=Apolygus lucorum TaxID=248454 RepID=A0A6A4K411_APOLU|nr:hypothetical protein GE061_010279 [Apolygus lucorum]